MLSKKFAKHFTRFKETEAFHCRLTKKEKGEQYVFRADSDKKVFRFFLDHTSGLLHQHLNEAYRLRQAFEVFIHENHVILKYPTDQGHNQYHVTLS